MTLNFVSRDCGIHRLRQVEVGAVHCNIFSVYGNIYFLKPESRDHVDREMRCGYYHKTPEKNSQLLHSFLDIHSHKMCKIKKESSWTCAL